MRTPLCRDCCESETTFYTHSQECQIFSNLVFHVTNYSYSLGDIASCPRCGLPLCRDCCESETTIYTHSQECQIFSKIREERPEVIAGLVRDTIFFRLRQLSLCLWAKQFDKVGYLSKGISCLKQKSTQHLTPFSGSTVLNALPRSLICLTVLEFSIDP